MLDYHSPPAQRKRIRTYASSTTVDGLNRRVTYLEDQLTSLVSQLNKGGAKGVKLSSPQDYGPSERKFSEDGTYEDGDMEGMSEMGDSDDDTLDQEADAAATLEL
jgi:hypothetical protein